MLHAAYWKHAVMRALDPGLDVPFDRSPSNWPSVPDAADPGLDRLWAADRAYLAEMHRRLIAAAAAVPAGSVLRKPAGRKWTAATYLAGAAAHDAYHLGQIQLLKRLATPGPSAAGRPASVRRRAARPG